jgi:signal peptidase I
VVDESTSSPETTRLHKGLAWTSLVIGIIAIGTLGCLAIGPIAGIVIGIIAVKRVRRSPEGYGGLSLAGAGIVLNSFGLLIAVLMPLVLVFIVQPVRVEGGAMRPTLNDGDRIFLGKQIGRIERGDIVAFWFPDDPSKTFIKRVVGLPGEAISIDSAGGVSINGTQIAEPYLSPDRCRFPTPLRETYIKPHYYFVMGDNRDQSNDSRRWGLVPEKYIYGKFISRYYSSAK